MNLRSGKTYNYFEKCEKCQTLNKVMKRQAKANVAVACGQISEGEYLMLSNIAKKLYECLTESCNCLEPVDEPLTPPFPFFSSGTLDAIAIIYDWDRLGNVSASLIIPC